jgi:hypothetical protein
MSAARYGFRGSKEIKKYLVKPYQSPRSTFTEHTPKFLDSSFRPDEWVPPIIAGRISTINNLETPKLWPENAEYVTGSKLKKLPTSVQYKRETTVANEEPPDIPPTVAEFLDRCGDETKTLRDYSRMERENTFMSLPMTAQATFASGWNDRLAKSASGPLRVTMKMETPVFEAHTLTDATDVLRYSGPMAMIVHTQTTEELKFRLQLERTANCIPYELRWRHNIVEFRAIKNRLKREQSMTVAIRDIGSKLRRDAIAAGSPTTLRRAEFINAIAKITFCDGIITQRAAMLFSVFDHLKKNTIRFVDILASWAALDRANDPAIDKLSYLWSIHEMYGDDVPPIDMALEVLLSCCASSQEKKEVEKLFRKEFRPVCYELAVKSRPWTAKDSPTATATATMTMTNLYTATETDPHAGSVTFEDSPLRSARRKTKPFLSPMVPVEAMPSTIVVEKANTEAIALLRERLGPRKDQTLADLAPFNISDNYLNKHTFVVVLGSCSRLVELFDNQLSEKLAQCYGIDERRQPLSPSGAGKDYSWILKTIPGGEDSTAGLAAQSFFHTIGAKNS